jgi:hypothetical protein
MCAVQHPDKLQELDSGRPAAAVPGSGSNGKSRAASRLHKRAFLAADERRLYPRLPLTLPLRVRRIAGQPVGSPTGLLTKDISSCGVRFQAPHAFDVDTPIELEIELVAGPLGGRRLQMVTLARIVRAEPAQTPGWREFGASFEEITFHSDASLPAPAV